MAEALERRRRRALDAKRRRSRRSTWVALSLVAFATAAGVSVTLAGTPGDRGDDAAPPKARTAAPLPTPPRPIPGFLLIADRGNNRILLVDGRKRILWRYPRPGV